MKQKMKRSLVRGLLIGGAVALLGVVACAMGSPYYIVEPFGAQVVDEQTGEPIQGVVVVANWQLVRGGLDGERQIGQLEVKETITDARGNFFIDGFTRLNPTLAELRSADPRVLLFRGGYEAQVYYSQLREPKDYPAIYRKAEIAGQVLKLPPLGAGRTGPTGEQEIFYRSLRTIVHPLVEDCNWKKTPGLFAAMDAENSRLRIQFPDAVVNLEIESFTNWSESPCRLTREALKEISK